MTTTIMRDSVVGDQWIQQSMQAVPIQRIINPDTGEFTGDILTGPVRLAFTDLFEIPAATKDNPNPKYGSALLFPPGVDLAILYEEYYKVCAQEFAAHYDAATQTYGGIRSPFHAQDEKLKFGGFTPGCNYINTGTQYKPPVTDNMHNPIVDQSRVYPGVWAIVAINAYAYKAPTNKGVAFGIQNVMIIGDDSKFGGGAKASKDQFAGVNITAPITRPDASQMAGVAPAPAAAIPGYSAPGGGAAPLAAPVGVPIATVPAAAPAQPSVPPVTTSPTNIHDL